jgi:ATP adenylyltransferase
LISITEIAELHACCLCSTLASQAGRARWDRALFESPNFEVLPSLGSLVEGWMLLVPKEHFLCTGALRPELVTEYKTLRATITTYISSKYGSACIFEHGPGQAHRQVGCGVDHAHLHILPLPFGLLSAAAKFLPAGISWADADHDSCRSAWEQGLDYLYVEQPVGVGRIAVHAKFGSQIFRKAIAARLGVLDQFNWREHPRLDVIDRTIEGSRAVISQ